MAKQKSPNKFVKVHQPTKDGREFFYRSNLNNALKSRVWLKECIATLLFYFLKCLAFKSALLNSDSSSFLRPFLTSSKVAVLTSSFVAD